VGWSGVRLSSFSKQAMASLRRLISVQDATQAKYPNSLFGFRLMARKPAIRALPRKPIMTRRPPLWTRPPNYSGISAIAQSAPARMRCIPTGLSNISWLQRIAWAKLKKGLREPVFRRDRSRSGGLFDRQSLIALTPPMNHLRSGVFNTSTLALRCCQEAATRRCRHGHNVFSGRRRTRSRSKSALRINRQTPPVQLLRLRSTVAQSLAYNDARSSLAATILSARSRSILDASE
jgi:hypothetical protein